MKIPKKFENILKTNQTLHAVVLDVITSYQPIYDDNKLFFFEEYTDHGIKHIENVLNAAEFIIHDQSFEILTPKEVTILILSIILHDIGMHIEFSTFKSLINGNYDHVRINVIDSSTWNQIWNEYLSEAKRFNSIQKKNIFGNEFIPFQEPDLSNKDSLTGYDKKLIGEFIRRNHARLAHEIAFVGIYGNNKSKIDFGSEKLTLIHRQLSGILARSHGINIRDTFAYLQEIATQGWRNPDDINIIFLMAVLRIADYIQIDNTRVNEFLLKLKTLNSPISIKEHNAHLAITSISFNQPDNERIFIICAPSDSQMLIKLRNLFSDIQKELDMSWAVLGEIYGFLQKQMKIKFRRITSNLDDKKFLQSLPYVPQKISFEVNNELSKLLVGPLYGNDPRFGIRELVQNAVDACIEREYTSKKTGINYVPKIRVSIKEINEFTSQFNISDNGKGMTLNEILFYFLNVGSSFRKSLSWKKEYVDDDGHSQVNRNGKFGIGVLAAFLLGDELTVETTHFEKQITYSFTTKIDSDFIELTKQSSKKKGGTSISMLISNDKVELLKQNNERRYYKEVEWNEWFVYDDPNIEYFYNGKKLENKHILDRTTFYSFATKEFERIEWSYQNFHPNKYYTHPFCICNGIIITLSLDLDEFEYYQPKLYRDRIDYVIIDKPSLLIEDKNGIFPIKLDRNDIDCDELPFEKELLAEVSKLYIAELLTVDISPEEVIKPSKIRHKAEFIYSKNGYSLNFDYFIDKLKSKNRLLRIITRHNHLLTNEILKFDNCFIYPVFAETINLTNQDRNVAPICGGRILLKKKNYNELFKEEKKRLSAWAKSNHKVEFTNRNYVIYNIKSYNQSPIFFKSPENIDHTFLSQIESIQEIDFSFFKMIGGIVLNTLLEKYIGNNVVIPYDIQKRKIKYKQAFKDLEHFM